MTTNSKEAETKIVVPSRTATPKTVKIQDLMGSARELIILHAENQYRLRITSNGKLILTK
jgi:hemin uptake protein HemP